MSLCLSHHGHVNVNVNVNIRMDSFVLLLISRLGCLSGLGSGQIGHCGCGGLELERLEWIEIELSV